MEQKGYKTLKLKEDVFETLKINARKDKRTFSNYLDCLMNK